MYLLSIYFLPVQPISYLVRTNDSFEEMAPGVCEAIQGCIYNVTMISIFVYRKEFKQLLDDLKEVFKGNVDVMNRPLIFFSYL